MEAAAAQVLQGPVLASGDLRVGRVAGIAARRRVDEDEEPFRPDGLAGGVGAVLGADVDCRLGGKMAGEKVVELGLIMAAEEDVVMEQRKARGLGDSGPGDGGEGAGLRPGGADGAQLTKTPGRDGVDVGIADDRVGLELVAINGRDTFCPAIGDADGGDFVVVADGDALTDRQIGERARQRVHASPHPPDALAFEVGHEHQGGGRPVGGRAAVGSIAAEELAQAGIAEMLRERRRERGEGTDAGERARARAVRPATVGRWARMKVGSRVRQMLAA